MRLNLLVLNLNEHQAEEIPSETQQKPNRNPTESQKKPNHKPITNNHKPNIKTSITQSAGADAPKSAGVESQKMKRNKTTQPKAEKASELDLLLANGVNQATAQDYLQTRKSKRAWQAIKHKPPTMRFKGVLMLANG